MADTDLFVHAETDDPSSATVTVDASARASHDVDPKLYGKFCEHLGTNVYHGMEAQVLFNPVFGEWHFRAGERRPSGGFVSENDPARVEEQVRAHARRSDYHEPFAYPRETDPDALLDAYRAGLAFGWQPVGDVRCSPDTGPNGNRAQRLGIEAAGDGVVQETRLPLHRVREFEFRTRIRSVDPTTATVSLCRDGDVLDAATLEVDEEWAVLEGDLDLSDADLDEDGVFELALTAAEPANLVVERLFLYPGDHVNHADPEIVEKLRESGLPLLRWPGGNFVSGYDWTDGVGPVDQRPVRKNPAWGGLEPNTFGTAEFVEFCDAVGCEPSLCVNAGDGTPEAAAKWVEYCNGDPKETEMGRLRAEHGHEEPFDITYWEIGNELWGPWQVRWTTPAGNADRYQRFREAMLEADSSIEITACGVVTNDDRPWNDVLLEECGEDVRAISSHPLAGGTVDASTDPDELYHAFMGYADQLGEQYAELESRMRAAGIDDPKLDVTELQLFASLDDGAESGERDAADGGLTPDTMPSSTTVSEALYDACVRHALIRLGPFVELLTHSATVNHGGGLWKDGERVWANPCHYGRAMGTAQAGETPVAVEVACDTITTETTFREIDPVDVPAVDAMATVDDGALTVVLVNRASRSEPITTTLETAAFDAGGKATVTTLGGDAMHAENTRDEPERVVPESETVPVDDGVTVELPAYSMARVEFATDQ